MGLQSKIVGTAIHIELADLARMLSDEDKQDLSKLICFDEAVLSAVTNMVAEPHRYGEIWPGWSLDWDAMQRVRERIAPMLDAASQAIIKNQRDELIELYRRKGEIENDLWLLRMRFSDRMAEAGS